MTDVAEEIGLRERKRRDTRRAILFAAVELVRERGLDGATVDEISRRAGISPRTFFNYYPSKEAVIAGESPSLPPESAIEDFVNGHGRILDDLAQLLVNASDTSMIDDREAFTARMTVVKEHPQLISVRMAGMRQFEDNLVAVVERRMLRQWPELESHPAELATRAHLLVSATSGVLKHAWHSWVYSSESDETGLAEGVVVACRQLEQMISAPAAR